MRSSARFYFQVNTFFLLMNFIIFLVLSLVWVKVSCKTVSKLPDGVQVFFSNIDHIYNTQNAMCCAWECARNVICNSFSFGKNSRKCKMFYKNLNMRWSKFVAQGENIINFLCPNKQSFDFLF